MSATKPRAPTQREDGPSQLGWLAAILDLMPTPLLLVEPGTARVTFANKAADRLSGGEFPRGELSTRYGAHPLTDASGRRLTDEELPSVRAARGERVKGFEMDWHLPGGVRSLLISTDTVPAAFGHGDTIVLAFEDVTALKTAEREAARQAEENARLYEDAQAAQGRSVEALALLDAIFQTAPVGLAYLDRELRYVRVNPALAAMNGIAAPEHLGRPVHEVLPELGEELVATLRAVMETGEAVVGADVSLQTSRVPGGRRHFLASFYPVHDVAGAVSGLGTILLETTEAKRAEEERERALTAEREARRRAEAAERRARFLAEAGALLSETLDYEETLGRVASLAVPERAQWCAIDMLGADGSIARVALAHAEPERERYGWELSQRWPPAMEDPDGLARVLRTGTSLLYPDIPDELLVESARDAEHLRVIRELKFRSCMIVPLRSRGRVLGTLTFVNDSEGPRFDEEDLGVAEELAARAAAAVENARLYRSRSAIARTLQESLLPPHLPTIPGLELAARYRPAGEDNEVGGDFYDVFALGDDQWALVIGDVCGKGAEAAAVTALMRYTVRAAAMVAQVPSEVFAQLNAAMLRQGTDNRFGTAVFARLEVSDAGTRVCLASGGHPLPLLLRADGTARSVGEPGTLLGVLPEVSHENCQVDLGPGDALLLFTDGLVEAGAPERVMSPEALVELAASLAGLPADEIARRVEEHAVALQNGVTRDDLALLVAAVPAR